MLFRDELRRLRTEIGLSQSGLAEKAKIPLGTLKNYEQGIRFPTFQVVVKLAAAVGVDCSAFAACSDVAEEQPPPAPKKKGKK